MKSPINLAARAIDISTPSPLATNLLIALLTLVIVSLLLATLLLLLRRYQRISKAESTHSLHKDTELLPPRQSRHRRTPSTLSLNFSSSGPCRPSILVYQEKHDQYNTTLTPPLSPIPEIRITLADEVDDSGKFQTGRVVVVHMGENGMGLAPLEEELPKYQRDASERFYSLDIERLGGLREA